MTNYYDLVLGVIPLALGGVATLLTVLGIPLTTAVGLSGGLSVGVIGHAMFVNAPVDATPETDGSATDALATDVPAAGESGFQSAD
jgi:hypothetical protein